MDNRRILQINLDALETPLFILDEVELQKNLSLLKEVQEKSGSEILLALKGYASYVTFPMMKNYLAGVCAGSLYEARLGKEEFGKEVHTYAPAFADKEFPKILEYSDYVTFNSIAQLERFMPVIRAQTIRKEVGLRVNPEKSIAGEKFGLYDPCATHSRLGVTAKEFDEQCLEYLSGLHVHALCEQNQDALEELLEVLEEKFSPILKRMNWINLGGGHHITREDYDCDKLCRIVQEFKARYPSIQRVYLEPGEAVVWNSAVFATKVLDVVKNSKNIAILDTSVETHLLDVLLTRYEPMPYIPTIWGAGRPGELEHTYTLGGLSCAAGDVIGEYSFSKPLRVGDVLLFLDMAYYTIVKTTMFNGIALPGIATMNAEGNVLVIKTFRYEEYKNRLS